MTTTSYSLKARNSQRSSEPHNSRTWTQMTMKTNGYAMVLMKKKDLSVDAKADRQTLGIMRELKDGRIQTHSISILTFAKCA